MRRLYLSILILLAFYAFTNAVSAKTAVPGRTKYRVNDYAGIMDEATKKYLEELIASMKQKTSDPIEVMVATFKSLDGWGIPEFAREYGEKWRLSKTGRDNGVILLVVLREGRIFIGVGRNLKDILTDRLMADITENRIMPEFKKGDYPAGIKTGIEAIVETLNNSEIPKDDPRSMLRNITLSIALLITLFLLSTNRDGSSSSNSL